MDFVFETFLKGIFRGIVYVVGELIVRFVFYYTAALIFRGISIGKYPTDLHQDPFETPSAILLTASGALMYILGAIYLVSNYG